MKICVYFIFENPNIFQILKNKWIFLEKSEKTSPSGHNYCQIVVKFRDFLQFYVHIWFAWMPSQTKRILHRSGA